MSERNIGIISSGDPEKDRSELERAKTFYQRTDQGLCPNGCGQLEWSDEGYRGDCPNCNFMWSPSVPYGIRDENYINE